MFLSKSSCIYFQFCFLLNPQNITWVTIADVLSTPFLLWLGCLAFYLSFLSFFFFFSLHKSNESDKDKQSFSHFRTSPVISLLGEDDWIDLF